jgi:hypothetical protein
MGLFHPPSDPTEWNYLLPLIAGFGVSLAYLPSQIRLYAEQIEITDEAIEVVRSNGRRDVIPWGSVLVLDVAAVVGVLALLAVEVHLRRLLFLVTLPLATEPIDRLAHRRRRQPATRIGGHAVDRPAHDRRSRRIGEEGPNLDLPVAALRAFGGELQGDVEIGRFEDPEAGEMSRSLNVSMAAISAGVARSVPSWITEAR